MIATTQTIRTPTVILFRFFSATPEDPADEEIPPPNMSEIPPPRPLCINTAKMSSRLATTMRTIRVILSACTVHLTFRQRLIAAGMSEFGAHFSWNTSV